MTIVLREMSREAADAILAGERPGDVRVADDYPTEFSVGVAQCVGAEGQFGPFFQHRLEDGSSSGRSVVRSSMTRGSAWAEVALRRAPRALYRDPDANELGFGRASLDGVR